MAGVKDHSQMVLKAEQKGGKKNTRTTLEKHQHDGRDQGSPPRNMIICNTRTHGKKVPEVFIYDAL